MSSRGVPYFEVRGKGDSGLPPVLFCSGLGGSARYWEPQIEAFAAHRQVVVYDQRGTGRSPGPLPDAYAMRHMAQDALQVLDAVGAAKADIVGHALGGLIGLDMAHAWADRVHKLVIINGWAALSPHTARCFDIRLELLSSGGWSSYVRAQPLFLYPSWWMDRNPERLAAEERHALTHPPAKADLLSRISALRAFAPQPLLADIAAPTLVVASEDDLLAPYDGAAALARDLARADFSLFPRGGHAVNVTEPERFNAEVLDFLARR
jgi:aminoacrylate hydrolase